MLPWIHFFESIELFFIHPVNNVMLSAGTDIVICH